MGEVHYYSWRGGMTMAENSVFLLLGFCVGAMLLYAYMKYKHNKYIKQKAEEAKRKWKWKITDSGIPYKVGKLRKR